MYIHNTKSGSLFVANPAYQAPLKALSVGYKATIELPDRYIRNVPVIPTRGTTRYGYNNAPMWSLSSFHLDQLFKFTRFDKPKEKR